MRRLYILSIAAALLVGACSGQPVTLPKSTEAPGGVIPISGSQSTSTPTAFPPVPSLAATEPAGTATATTQAPVNYGPDNFPAGINPLTGLPAADPSLLNLPAVLVSVTNFPASARPQAGLSFASMIFEIYISEGTTRYLAVFYGDFPKATVAGANGSLVDRVGPVRSGRLPYVHVRDAFQWSCLVYASASEELRARLRGCDIVYGKDPNDINSAFVDVTKLKSLAQGNARPNQPFNYTGNLFSDTVPAGGKAADSLKVFTSFLNQAVWSYDTATGKYLRSQNSPTAADQFTPDRDRLTGGQLAFSNVVVLFANHIVVSPTIIDVDLGNGTGGYAYLFRDGQAIPIQWSTIGGDYEKTTGLRRPIRFTDRSGTPIALKPGNTWVHVMTPFSTVSEQSAGDWLARFYAPSGAR
jgi:DUF3048 family protein